MRYLTAPLIFPGDSAPLVNGVVVTDESGMIIDLLDGSDKSLPHDILLERFDGLLCPGFINTHCHLELSHLKDQVSRNTGLTGFISEIVGKRASHDEAIIHAMEKADSEMGKNGIVAVGDISNSTLSATVKRNSKLFYHTFVELFDLIPERAEKTFSEGLLQWNYFREKNLAVSLSPHAPYTVSGELFSLINDHAEKHEEILTIHNQETGSERDMFMSGTGKLFEQLIKINPAIGNRTFNNKSSLEFILEKTGKEIPLQLVHNTFTDETDFMDPRVNQSDLYWCICVNANLYIENRTPDINLLMKENCVLTIGTDSYASNSSLSVLDELKTITQHFPSVALKDMIKWATSNGASFLRMNDKMGSLEKGKVPGILNIDNIDLEKVTLTSRSSVQRIV
jgi:aminodeoxyfutalosine deaminase